MALPSQRGAARFEQRGDAVGQTVNQAMAQRLLAGLRDLRDGNFRRRLVVTDDGLWSEIASTFNELAERNQGLAAELERVGRAANEGEWPIEPVAEMGPSGGRWSDSAAAVNGIVRNVLGPATELSRVLDAVARGDLSQRLPRRAGDRALPGRLGSLTRTVNAMLDQLSTLTTEISRVTGEIGTHGRLGGQAQVPGLEGAWRELADSVNEMAADLTGQLRDISQVAKAVAAGDLTRKITVEVSGETLELKNTLNTMVDQLSAFADEVTRVSREVASEGRLGGQAEVPAAAGTWRALVDSVNFMANNLTAQVRNIAQVATAVARGDLTQKIDVDARGEILQLKNTLNTMVDQLSAFADEVTRVAREVGTEGKLGGQARVHGVAGTWKDLTDNVNIMADNLTSQVRSIATVATAVAGGDLSKKITVEAKGEVAALAETINGMVETLRAFAEQVTLVAREVGTEGMLGGQARVPNVAGTWKDLTDNVNFMARNLTSQVRNIAQVTTAVARGDLSKKIDVDARGEILELKTTINTMVDQLSAFASEVTRVAREVGTEGKLGGQAEVADVSGTWRRLTESVNRLAGNLTAQVRAIAAVATAVTEGDMTRQITIDASGELADLKDNINRMIGNLKETTRTNQEQDWLKTNLARMSALMQGLHDLDALSSLIMSELTPLVSAQYGAFFLIRQQDDEVALEHTAGYGRPVSHNGSPVRFVLGESLVGQAAVDKQTILVTDAPPDYIRIGSGLGGSAPVNVVVVPVLFEGEVLGVIELASLRPFTSLHLDLLERLKETIGVDVNTIVANSRTEALLGESQHLAQELQARSEQLQRQQIELQRSNTELEEKAALLASRNRDIELKNIEIEQARQELEERAHELSQASTYKSDFLANMSHELRTPLNSALILAKLLADNMEGNLTPQQVDLAKTIHSAGTDLLQLINDVLDLSKVEAGHMSLLPEDVELSELTEHVESLYRPLTEDKGLEFSVVLSPSLPPSLRTDRNRLEQILRNMLSNAVKFTDKGKVELRIRPAPATEVTVPALRSAARRVAFAVRDTGIGIPSDKLSRIFEAFQQLDGTTSRKYGGTGLGLSISRELTTLLGGELQVRSDVGVGSTFTLYLPVETEVVGGELVPEPARDGGQQLPPGHEADERKPAQITSETAFDVSAEGIDPPFRVSELARREAHSHEPAEQEVVPPQDSIRFNGEKVLLVDDDQRSVYAMTSLLEQHGLQVVYADSGIAGLQALQEHCDITVVLMDVMMPELDGNATIETIRQMPRYRDLTVIAVTAKAMKGDRERSLAAGATDIITKPVDVNRLLDLLSVYLPAGYGHEEA
ncbi:GAF sensor hybrid histidine kinase [Saccharopolyspora erythraea NRRL 2338]|uniref:Circadian input-output histidine kinase CikA n=3 Tax=Saccharopolyspora erythraea TaxID=1836 RepID=A4FFD9_SACEN|nr:HAMP domain-containing protein [Saccharopolyspora erythraea]PFG96485.1 GAF sensor hybrid histidine kinase [Saccharopolyspora erythraea NRRL 2338]QRK92980.1 HAMP domain-containing protein [Saccharopolyspora erythraea]CAM02764.1 sensor histidine kinase/response regulator [Saccharopolyspora erythraea NRRL 2338]